MEVELGARRRNSLHSGKIKKAQQALEAEAREPARREGKANPDAAQPDPKAQRNFTDPESRIMKTADVFHQCCNAQVAVTVGSQFVGAEDVVTSATIVREANAAS